MTSRHIITTTILASAGIVILLTIGTATARAQTPSEIEQEWQRKVEMLEMATIANDLNRAGKPQEALTQLGEFTTCDEFISIRSNTLYASYLQLGDWENFLRVARTTFELEVQRLGERKVLPSIRATYALGLHLTGKETEAWETMWWQPEQYDESIADSDEGAKLKIVPRAKSRETHGIDLAILHMSIQRELRPDLAICEALYAHHPKDQYLQYWYGRVFHLHQSSEFVDLSQLEFGIELLDKASAGPDQEFAKLSAVLKQSLILRVNRDKAGN